jgi:hypothetical protein
VKTYEKLELTLENLSDSDVIATSADVTTDKITIKWNGAETDAASFDL